jgi:hypothetical protein
VIDYAKLAIAGTLLLISFSIGWYIRNLDYKAYKQSVEIVAKTQEAKVESIQKQHELVTKGIENEYEAKLSAIRNYYKSTSVWNKSNSSTMPSLSAAPSTTDVIASYNQLAGLCAETTQQVVSLQDWINAQLGIK